MHFAKACPQLHVTLQDSPSTIEQAKTLWKSTAPDIVNEGRVDFAPIDFLKESPVKGCDYYFVSFIAFDQWYEVLTYFKLVAKEHNVCSINFKRYHDLLESSHNWADIDCKTILANVKRSMKPTARLIIRGCLACVLCSVIEVHFLGVMLDEFLIQHVSDDAQEGEQFIRKVFVVSYTRPRSVLDGFYLGVGP